MQIILILGHVMENKLQEFYNCLKIHFFYRVLRFLHETNVNHGAEISLKNVTLLVLELSSYTILDITIM